MFGTITSGAYRLFRSQRSADTSHLHAAVECCCHRLVLANHSRSTCLPEMMGGEEGRNILMLKLANNNIRPLCQVARQLLETDTNETGDCGEHANQSKKVLGRAHYISRCQLFQRWCSCFVVPRRYVSKKKKKKRESKTFTLKKASTTRLNYPSTYRPYQSTAAIRSPVL